MTKRASISCAGILSCRLQSSEFDSTPNRSDFVRQLCLGSRNESEPTPIVFDSFRFAPKPLFFALFFLQQKEKYCENPSLACLAAIGIFFASSVDSVLVLTKEKRMTTKEYMCVTYAKKLALAIEEFMP